VERSTAGLDVAALTQEVQILQLVPVEVAGDVDALRPHNHHLKMELNIYRSNHQKACSLHKQTGPEFRLARHKI
jgi:hypothetical protein